MKTKKKIILVLFLVLIILNIYFMTNRYLINQKSYLIFNYDNIIDISDKKIKSANFKEIKSLNYSKAKLYLKNEVIDGYINLVDISSEAPNFYDSKFSLYQKEYDYMVLGEKEVKNYSNLLNTSINDSDKKVIDNFLKTNGIKNLVDYNLLKANLQKNGMLYIVEIESLDEPSEYDGSIFIFTYSDNKTNIIYKNKNKDTATKNGYFNTILDVNNDDYIDIVMMFGEAGNSEVCIDIYQYDLNSGKYIPIINCEGE